MKMTIISIKKYNAIWNYIISINGPPVSITAPANKAVPYFMGQHTDLSDGLFIRQLNKYKNSHRRIENEDRNYTC